MRKISMNVCTSFYLESRVGGGSNTRAFIMPKLVQIPQGKNLPWEDLVLVPGSLISQSAAELGLASLWLTIYRRGKQSLY